LGWIRRWPVRP